MSQQNVDLIRSLYDGFAAGEMPTILGAMDPGIVWNEAENFIYADRNPYQGPAAIVEGLFMRLASEWDYWNLAIEEILGCPGDTVVTLGRYHAKNKTTGSVLNAQFVHVWRIRNGKVIRFQQYTDTAQAARAVRAS